MLDQRLKLLLYSSSIWFLGEGMFGPLFAIFADKIGGDVLEVSGVWAVYLVATGIFTILVGKLENRIGKEELLVAGYVLNAVFTFCYLFVSSPTDLFFNQIGLGIASALSTPTWNSLYADCERHGAADVGNAWALADGYEQIVTGAGVVMGGLLVNSLSFESLFVVMGVIQTCAAFYIAQILKEKYKYMKDRRFSRLLRASDYAK